MLYEATGLTPALTLKGLPCLIDQLKFQQLAGVYPSDNSLLSVITAVGMSIAFNNVAMAACVQYLWQTVRWRFMISASLYVLSLVSLVTFTVVSGGKFRLNDTRDEVLWFANVVFAFIFGVNEAQQLVSTAIAATRYVGNVISGAAKNEEGIEGQMHQVDVVSL